MASMIWFDSSDPRTWELAAPTIDPTSSWLLPRSTAIGWLSEEDTMSSWHLWWGPPAPTFWDHWPAVSACIHALYYKECDIPPHTFCHSFATTFKVPSRRPHYHVPFPSSPFLKLCHISPALKSLNQWFQKVGSGGPHYAPMWEHTLSSAPCRCVPTSSLRFHAVGCWAKIENWGFGFHNRRSAWPSRQKRG